MMRVWLSTFLFFSQAACAWTVEVGHERLTKIDDQADWKRYEVRDKILLTSLAVRPLFSKPNPSTLAGWKMHDGRFQETVSPQGVCLDTVQDRTLKFYCWKSLPDRTHEIIFTRSASTLSDGDFAAWVLDERKAIAESLLGELPETDTPPVPRGEGRSKEKLAEIAPESSVATMPSATPAPAAVQIPSASPSPTATPKPIVTATPTATPTATAAPTLVPTPTPVAVPKSTATPTPFATPKPTATPPPDATPKPMPTPFATPRPAATPQPTPLMARTPRVSPAPIATPIPVATPVPTPSATPFSAPKARTTPNLPESSPQRAIALPTSPSAHRVIKPAPKPSLPTQPAQAGPPEPEVVFEMVPGMWQAPLPEINEDYVKPPLAEMKPGTASPAETLAREAPARNRPVRTFSPGQAIEDPGPAPVYQPGTADIYRARPLQLSPPQPRYEPPPPAYHPLPPQREPARVLMFEVHSIVKRAR